MLSERVQRRIDAFLDHAERLGCSRLGCGGGARPRALALDQGDEDAARHSCEWPMGTSPARALSWGRPPRRRPSPRQSRLNIRHPSLRKFLGEGGKKKGQLLGGQPFTLALIDVRLPQPAVQGEVEIWSSRQEIVAQASDAGIRAGLIASGVMPNGGAPELVDLARQLGADVLSLFPGDLEQGVVLAYKALDMPFMCGTPSDVPAWRYLEACGARAIITDEPLACARAPGIEKPLTIGSLRMP